MSTPYYADDLVTLHHGDCRDLLPALERGSVDVLLTDPPYFQVKDEEWDRQWRAADEFLVWLGGVLDLCKPLLKPSASVWVFASPFMVRRVEDLVGDRFRVLNSIRWVKADSTHNRAEVAALRRYSTAWEGIIFAEQADDEYEQQAKALHRQLFASVGRYIEQERERSGLTRKELAARLSGYKNLASATANVWNWELGKNLISAADYEALRAALGAGFFTLDYASICQQWTALTREYEARRDEEGLRRPFQLARATGPVTDLWTFPQVENYPGKHPCEKPESMIRHMLSTSTRPGATVLDPFAGSAATLRVCKELGLRGVGMETNMTYCRRAVHRLSQEVLALELAGG
ncbi:MAG: site-specific DNA-methyltransferase [Gemmatimonadota bacterium]|nr:site-specific DNA-methyltransferase [Gemmatimonadota bacterium]